MALSNLKAGGYFFRVEVFSTNEDGTENVHFTEDYDTASTARNVGSNISGWYGTRDYRVTKYGFDAWLVKRIPKTKAEAIRELAKTLD